MIVQDTRTQQQRKSLFFKPADDSLLINEDKSIDDSAGTSLIYNNPCISLSIQQQRSRLPIFKHKNRLIYLINKFQVVIVVGETGCGKSTQLPQYILETSSSPNIKICITQPRRVAAVTLASRVADEMNCALGDKVGYSVRFNDAYCEKTKIKFVTDGILLRELLTDPLLLSYNLVIIDEAHERSVNTDLILSFLRKIIAVRLDFKIIISSATIDAEFFYNFFELNESNDNTKNTASIVSVEGRTFPVKIFYTKVGVPDYVKATADLILKIHKSEEIGDILAFLTGQDEVTSVCSMVCSEAENLQKSGKYDNLIIVPLYSGLSAKDQLRAFDSTPYRTRKVIVATNIAETSITIPGVTFVIDCGFVKMRLFNVQNDLETLMIIPCSKSSADQRAGRAGRVRPGKCFRLYPESEYEKLALTSIPEIQRGDLAKVILQLKALGVQNVLKFNYLSRPSSNAMIRGLHILYALGAIDDFGLLTKPIGVQMAELPLPPMFAKALISSVEFECSVEIAAIIALMQIHDPFILPMHHKHKAEIKKRSFAVQEGDHLTLLNVFSAFLENGRSANWCSQNYLNYKGLCRAEKIRDQLLNFLKQSKMKIVSCKGTIGDTAKIRRCLLNGFFSQVARYDYTGLYVTVKGENSFKVYKGSALMYRKEYPKWIFFTDVMQNSLRFVSEIELPWLEQVAQHYYDFGSELRNVNSSRIAEGRLANIN